MQLIHEIISHFPPLTSPPPVFENLQTLILSTYLEILDLFNIHLSLRHQLSYHSIDPIMTECVLQRIQQMKQSLSKLECSQIKEEIVRLNRILKSDFLLSNLQKRRKHTI